MSTFFLDRHLLTVSLQVQPILDAGALDEECVFLKPGKLLTADLKPLCF